MLILFDIDGTLVDMGGLGARAMVQAGRTLHGPAFTSDGIAFGGQLDPIILDALLVRNGIDPTPAAIDALRAEYTGVMERITPTEGGRALPGARELVEALERAGATVGVLTGNFGATGSMKLRACGLEVERFAICVWGDESPHRPPAREHLPPVAMERYRARFGPIEPSSVTIVGDTVHDVRCARRNGCRSLGVATGRTGAGALREAGADLAADSLVPTPELLRWLTSPR